MAALVGLAAAQQEVCDEPFTQADWVDVLDAVEESLTDLDGLRADRLLDYAHHELRCMDSVVRPRDVARMAMQESVLHWYDQDPDEALRWAWTAIDAVGARGVWPDVTPSGLMDALEENPLPEVSGPSGVGLLPPPKGAYLRNGFRLIHPLAPVRVPALVQVAGKRGEILETRWQDGAAFDDEWLGPIIRVTSPSWYDPPPEPTTEQPSARRGRQDVTLRWDTEPECAWKGAPRRVEATARQVQVNQQVFPVRSDADQRTFTKALRACGELRAARRFKRWREARKRLALTSAARRRSMEKALMSPEPTRRKRKQAG